MEREVSNIVTNDNLLLSITYVVIIFNILGIAIYTWQAI